MAWGEVGSLDGLPDGDTCTEEGCGSLEGESIGDGGDVSGKGDGVLLEGSMLGEAWRVDKRGGGERGEMVRLLSCNEHSGLGRLSPVLLTVHLGRLAVGLISMSAEVAGEARVGEPLDAYSVSLLDELISSLSQCYDYTCTLVSTAEGESGMGWPVANLGVEVGVADARVEDLD